MSSDKWSVHKESNKVEKGSGVQLDIACMRIYKKKLPPF